MNSIAQVGELAAESKCPLMVFFPFKCLNDRGPRQNLAARFYAKGVKKLNYADLMAPSTFRLLELAIAYVSDALIVNLNEMRSKVSFLAL